LLAKNWRANNKNSANMAQLSNTRRLRHFLLHSVPEMITRPFSFRQQNASMFVGTSNLQQIM
jgi:hypothetical protein